MYFYVCTTCGLIQHENYISNYTIFIVQNCLEKIGIEKKKRKGPNLFN